MQQSHYEVLGILPSAGPDEIRRAYKAKALETHPDKLEPTASFEEKQASEAKFHRVQEAFEVLRDPNKQRAYDIRHGFRVDKVSVGDISDAQRKRNQEREAWARKSWEQSEERFRILRQRAEQAREERMRQEQAAAEYSAMVERMLAQLYRKNPEWKERQQNVKRPPPTVSS